MNAAAEDSTFTMSGADAVWSFQYTGNFSSTPLGQFLIQQQTGTPTGGTLFRVVTSSNVISNAKFGDGTNDFVIGYNGNVTLAGAAIITAGGLVLGDASPDASGEFGYGSGVFWMYGANSEDFGWSVGSAANTVTAVTNTGVTTVDFDTLGIIAASFTVADAGNDNFLAITNNSGGRLPTASAYEMYPDAGVWKTNQNGTEYSNVLSPLAGQVSFTGPSAARSYVLPDAGSLTIATNSANQTLNFVTTGTIQGGIVISSDADGMDAAAMTAAGVRGTLFLATGAGTWILPTAVAGMSLCLMDDGAAHDLILDVTAGSTITLAGTEQADGVGITNASGSSTGDFVCVVSTVANKWKTMGKSGTWASQ
jgi:hypothetical protein